MSEAPGHARDDGEEANPVVKVKQRARLVFGEGEVSGCKQVKKDKQNKQPEPSKESKPEKGKQQSKEDRKSKGAEKLKEKDSVATREVLVQRAKSSNLSIPMSKLVRAEYVVSGADKFYFKYMLALTDTGTQKSKMRTIPFVIGLNDTTAGAALRTKAVITDNIPVLDPAAGVTSDFSFDQKNELLSRLNQIEMTEARASTRLFSGTHKVQLPTGDMIITAVYHAQRSNDIPADPAPGVPLQGDGSVTDSRMLMTANEMLEHMSSLHPREGAIMMTGYVLGVDFDTIRTASIDICRGAALNAAAWVLAIYEPLRELYVAPRTQGQSVYFREIEVRPEFASVDAMAVYLRSSILNWHYGLLMNTDFQTGLRDSMLQDYQGKNAMLRAVRSDTLVCMLDSSITVLNIPVVDSFITTQDSPGIELCCMDGVEENAKITAVALPFNYVFTDAVGYPAGLLALRLGLSRYNNQAMLAMRGRTTAEIYRNYLEKLRDDAATMRSKMGAQPISKS
eukprot:s1355_g12.t1